MAGQMRICMRREVGGVGKERRRRGRESRKEQRKYEEGTVKSRVVGARESVVCVTTDAVEEHRRPQAATKEKNSGAKSSVDWMCPPVSVPARQGRSGMEPCRDVPEPNPELSSSGKSDSHSDWL
jgi:hypothetical protein